MCGGTRCNMCDAFRLELQAALLAAGAPADCSLREADDALVVQVTTAARAYPPLMGRWRTRRQRDRLRLRVLMQVVGGVHG